MDKYSSQHHLWGVYAPSKRTRVCVRFAVPKYPLYAENACRQFQGTIFGFPVSGLNTKTSLIAIENTGPTLWTGGNFGPEAGLIGLVAMLLGMGAILLYVKLSEGSLSPASHLSEYQPLLKKVEGEVRSASSHDL